MYDVYFLISSLFRRTVRFCPDNHIIVPISTRQPDRILVPRATVRAQPLKHLEVPSISRT